MRHANKVLGALVVIALTLTLFYTAAYLSLVRTANESGEHVLAEDLFWVCAPHYRVGGRYAERFFTPAHRIDRQLRTEYWRMPGQIDVIVSPG
jgi:hypothetical protein